MKNIIEILKSQNITLTDDQVTEIEKAVKENYRTLNDYENQKKKLELAETKANDIQSAFDEFKKGFEGVNVEDLKGKVDTLSTTLETQKAEYEKQIKTMELESTLKEVATSLGCVDFDLAKTQLKYDELLTSKNQKDDVTTAFNALKEAKPILFGTNEPKPEKKVGVIGGNDGGETKPAPKFKEFF